MCLVPEEMYERHSIQSKEDMIPSYHLLLDALGALVVTDEGGAGFIKGFNRGYKP